MSDNEVVSIDQMIEDLKVDDEAREHVRKAMTNMMLVFSEAALVLQNLPIGQKKPATKLAGEIAEKYDNLDMTQTELYPTLNKVLFEKYPGVGKHRGAHGGLYRLPPAKDEVKTVDAVKPDAEIINT